MVNWKLVGLISVATGFAGILITLLVHLSTGGQVPNNYGIIIDAGSSHTGITLYKWPGEKNKCTGLVEQVAHRKLDKAMANFTQSSKYGEYLMPAVREVKSLIPVERQEVATLYLGATAGMRLLNLSAPQLAEQLINGTRDLLAKESGLLTEEVAIIDGKNEALFAWISTNYLSDNLINKASQPVNVSTLGMLDMGGASAQMAYGVKTSINGSSKDNQQLYEETRLYGINHTVRVSSSLCFGAEQARLRHLALLINGSSAENATTTIVDPCLPKGSNRTYTGRAFARNVCLQLKSGPLVDPQKNYSFIGASDPEKCLQAVRILVDSKECEKKHFNVCLDNSQEHQTVPEGIKLVAMSAYYYSVKVLNVTENSTISKQDFEDQTKTVCQVDSKAAKVLRGSKAKYADLYCFQLSYVYNTLVNVYGLTGNWTNLEFRQKINKSELGWSLGYMINATNAIPAEKPSEPYISTSHLILFLILGIICFIAGLACLMKGFREQRTSNKEIYQQIRQM